MKRKNDFELKELVQKFQQLPQIKEKLYLQKIKDFWLQEMGSTVANSISKIELRRGKLYIRMDSSVMRQEILYSKDQWVARMNQVIGEEYVKDIYI